MPARSRASGPVMQRHSAMMSEHWVDVDTYQPGGRFVLEAPPYILHHKHTDYIHIYWLLTLGRQLYTRPSHDQHY